MSWIELIPTTSRSLEVKAVMAIGTVCSACSRFSAVTTISVTALADAVPADAAALAVAAWAPAPQADKPHAAQDSSRIRLFIRRLPEGRFPRNRGAAFILCGGSQAPQFRWRLNADQSLRQPNITHMSCSQSCRWPPRPEWRRNLSSYKAVRLGTGVTG